MRLAVGMGMRLAVGVVDLDNGKVSYGIRTWQEFSSVPKAGR